ncbi:hypothetical protein GCM10011390_09360 [Aureimonas endophytica]|uniref:Uncharacterized protein n=2 Tax=Aureimonas endophytica TaxID=2027858 RepID=A0A916ZER1_9HYPH|nr:hypothetical protein GCM10011390_09360 [Aureimonas endophytica]
MTVLHVVASLFLTGLFWSADILDMESAPEELLACFALNALTLWALRRVGRAVLAQVRQWDVSR